MTRLSQDYQDMLTAANSDLTNVPRDSKKIRNACYPAKKEQKSDIKQKNYADNIVHLEHSARNGDTLV